MIVLVRGYRNVKVLEYSVRLRKGFVSIKEVYL